MTLRKLPEGMELDLQFYMTDDEGLNIKLTVSGLPLIPADLDNPDAMAIARLFKLSPPPPSVGNWRPMTRAEIRDFKDDEEGSLP